VLIYSLKKQASFTCDGCKVSTKLLFLALAQTPRPTLKISVLMARKMLLNAGHFPQQDLSRFNRVFPGSFYKITA